LGGRGFGEISVSLRALGVFGMGMWCVGGVCWVGVYVIMLLWRLLVYDFNVDKAIVVFDSSRV